MKLITFNNENLPNNRAGVPSIGVNQKTGLFNINSLAAEAMQLKEGQQVTFHQDEESPENWYLEVVSKNGFVLRKKENITAGLLFNNASLARTIGEAMGISGSFKMKIAAESTTFEKRTFWGLLISSKE